VRLKLGILVSVLALAGCGGQSHESSAQNSARSAGLPHAIVSDCVKSQGELSSTFPTYNCLVEDGASGARAGVGFYESHGKLYVDPISHGAVFVFSGGSSG
jgi:hypothetical protein